MDKDLNLISNADISVSSNRANLIDHLHRGINPVLRALFRAQARLAKARIEVDGNSAPLPSDGRSIIFAANHTNGQDIPNIANALSRHFYAVIADDIKYDFITKLVCNLNGTIWLTRGDYPAAKSTRERAQALAVQKLETGNDILIFPEAVWNPCFAWVDGKPMLPFYKGVISIAQLSGAHIVPVITEYDQSNTCHIYLAEPFDYAAYGDVLSSVSALRAYMAQTKQQIRQSLKPAIDKDVFIEMRASWRRSFPIWDPQKEVTHVQGYKNDPDTISQWFLC